MFNGQDIKKALQNAYRRITSDNVIDKIVIKNSVVEMKNDASDELTVTVDNVNEAFNSAMKKYNQEKFKMNNGGQ